MTSKASARGSSAPASLLGFTEDPPRCGVGHRCLPRPGDNRLQSGTAQMVRCGVGGGLGHQLDQTGRDVPVCRISEMDRVVLQPDGDASRADEAGLVPIPIRKAVSGVEDDTPRKGCLQAASAA